VISKIELLCRISVDAGAIVGIEQRSKRASGHRAANSCRNFPAQPSADDRKNEGCKIKRDVFDEVLRTKEWSMSRLTIGGGKPTRQFGYSPEVCHGSETNIVALFRFAPSALTSSVSQFW
jgi:hypothetical protein